MFLKLLVKKTLCTLIAGSLCVVIPFGQRQFANAKEEQTIVSTQQNLDEDDQNSMDSQDSKIEMNDNQQVNASETADQPMTSQQQNTKDQTTEMEEQVWLNLDVWALSDEQFLEVLATFRTAVIQIINDYHDNLAQDWQDLRFEVGRLTQTTTQLDEEGFLPDAYFESHDQKGTAIPGCFQLLNRKWVGMSHPKKENRSIRAAHELSISSVVSKVQVPIFGHYMSNGSWKLSNGCQGFCADYLRAMPTSGVQAIDITPSQNEQLRRVLYYGYGGPANILGSLGFNEAQQIVITDDLVSYAYSQKCIATDELGGAIWRNGMFNVWKTIVEKSSPPAEFKVYIASFPGQGLNHKGQQVPLQPLAYGTMTNPEKGALQLIKAASDENFELASSTNYSLVGAVYKIVKGNQPEGATEVGRLTIGRDNASPILEVKPGIYWAKEVKAPKGYALDPTWHRIEVDANSSVQGPCRILVKDKPQYIPVDLLLKKRNALTGTTDARLQGARFRLCFYDIDPKYPEQYKKSKPLYVREDLICDENGEVNAKGTIFPIGVVTIEEIEAPEGFVLDDQVHVIPLDPKQSTSEVLEIYQVPIIYNRPESIILKKCDLKNGLPLTGAKFLLTSPSGKETQITVDKKGEAKLFFDEQGKWTLEEIQAPPNYQLNLTLITIEVNSDGIKVVGHEDSELIDFELGVITVKNTQQSFVIRLYKYDDNLQPLAGAEFSLFSDFSMSECVGKAVSDENGEVIFAGLAANTYVLAETKAPSGYILPTKPDGSLKTIFIRSQGGSGGYSFWVNMKTIPNQKPQEIKDGIFYNASSQGQYVLEGQFVNKIKATLPKTGSDEIWIILALSLIFFLIAMRIWSKSDQHRSKRN